MEEAAKARSSRRELDQGHSLLLDAYLGNGCLGGDHDVPKYFGPVDALEEPDWETVSANQQQQQQQSDCPYWSSG
jgi:hypothetical protein